MSGIVQGVLVAVAVVVSLLYSIWRLASARLRLRMLEALGALPAVRHLPGFAACRRLRQLRAYERATPETNT
jgi:hypothetical protein